MRITSKGRVTIPAKIREKLTRVFPTRPFARLLYRRPCRSQRHDPTNQRCATVQDLFP